MYREYEPDRRIVMSEGWEHVGERGFDDARTFAAFVNTLRWGSVTATDSNLFHRDAARYRTHLRAGVAPRFGPLRPWVADRD